MKPTIGRIVHYVLSFDDANAINKRRSDAQNLNAAGVTLASQRLGPQIHVGVFVHAGEAYPAIITRVPIRSEDFVNLQVFLDGNDVFWAIEVPSAQGNPGDTREFEHATWHWPERVS